MKKFITIVCILSFSLFATAQVDTNVSFAFKQYEIKGSLMQAEKPNGKAVLIIAGSGPTDRNCNSPMFKSNTYKFIATFLAENGYASLRYDKLGIGKSVPGKEEKDFVFSDNIDVARVAYKFLKNQKGINEIIVFGHSEGSLVGIVLSKQMKASKFISAAGPAFSADKVLKKQLAAIPDDKLRTEAISLLESMSAGKTVEKVNPLLLSVFRPSVQNYMISWIAYDPIAEITDLNIPILILQGDNDIQVDNENARELAAANPKATKVILSEITHILKKGPADRESNIDSYNSKNVDIDDSVKKALLDFLTAEEN